MEKVFKKLTVYISGLLIITTVFLIFVIPTYIRSERKIDFFSSNQIAENIRNMEVNMTSVIYVKNETGKWEEYQRLHGAENRIWVGIDKIPKALQDAFVSIEDEDFYTHKGVDWYRTTAAVGNKLFKFNEREFGGSTITQQLIKNVTMDNSKSATRKIREIVRALLIEKRLNKTQILEAYLNTIALGNGICGVQVAANYYFNKDVSQLNLTECVALAAITQNPSKYNPLTEKGAIANEKRRKTVLDKMLEHEKISLADHYKAWKAKLVLDTSQESDYEVEINNYFVDTLIDQVIDDLAEKYNLSKDLASTTFYNGGFKIYATMNPKIQAQMEKVYTNIKRYFPQTAKNLKGEVVHAQSAMTIMDYEGHIVGIVGGAGEKTANRGLNRATDSPRQPGSTMKPLGVYTLAVEKNLVDYTTKVLDQPIPQYYLDGKSGPKEWYGYYKGSVRLNYAIRKSMNAPPVRLLQEVGLDASYDFLVNKLKFKHLIPADKNLSSLALGGCHYGITTTESAAAYAIFGNQGVYHEPTTYFKIERANGEVVIDYDETGTQVIAKSTATIMNHLLREVVYGSEGTGRGISGYNSMKAYAKTGTSSESYDLWMVAGSPYYVGSVWYGFDFNHNISNQAAASNIWRDVMREVHRGLPKKEFTDSEDVVKNGIGYYKKGVTVTDPVYKDEYTSSEEISSSSLPSSSAPTSSAPTSSAPTESTTTSDSSGSEPTDSSGDTTTDSSSEDSSSGVTSAESSTPAGAGSSTDSSSSDGV